MNEDKKNLVVKDNALISASYSLTMAEQQLIFLGIVAIRDQYKNDIVAFEVGKAIEVSAESYSAQFNVSLQTAYEALKNSSKSLFQRQFSYEMYVPERNYHVANVTARWVSEIAYMDGLGIVRLTFSPTVAPLLVNLEKNFTSFELEQVSRLTSTYAIRIYELLIKWRSVGKTPMFELHDFRKKLGILDSQYQRMGQFKEKVLNFGIAQINEHTDLTVTYEQHKQGRVITGFTFAFKIKKDKKKATVEIKGRSTNNEDMFTVEGLNDKQLGRIARNPSFIADYNHLVSSTSPAGQNAHAWESEMVDRLKKDAGQFNKRPIRDYLK